ncbi:putative ribonuclease H-like domain-containing protein [Tanacetum coccineum]
MSPPAHASRAKYHWGIAFATGLKGFNDPVMKLRMKHTNHRVRIPKGLYPRRIEAKMTKKQVGGKWILVREMTMISKDGEISKFPRYHSSKEEEDPSSLEDILRLGATKSNTYTLKNASFKKRSIIKLYVPKVNAVGRKTSIKLPFDPNMPALEDVSIFDFSRNDEDDGAEADMNNLDTTIQVSPIPTTRIHKDHPLDQVIGDLQSATQTRKMLKNLEEHGFEEPKKVVQNFPDRVYMLKKTIVDYIQAPRAWYETLSTYLLDNEFQRGKIDKTLFIKRHKGDILLVQVYVDDIIFGSTKKELCNAFEKSMIGSLMYLTSSRPDIMFAVCACARYQVNPKVSHLHAMKRIFRFAYKSFDAKTINGEVQLHALVDGKKVIITEVNVRRDLQVEDAEDEVVYKERGDSLVRTATTASSLEAEQDNGSGLKCQETMGDTIAQTRFENVSKLSNDSLLARGNTLRSDEDRLKLNELMELCTNLQQRVLDLEQTNTSQHNEIDSLNRRVKKLEKRNRSRTHKLKRLYKVGLTTRVESSGDEESLDEDAF